MGLFSRKSKQAVPTLTGPMADWSRTVSYGHAAFDPADVDDARRGFPAATLEHFAMSTGWTYKNVEQLGAFVSTLPTWPDYIFNVCRGALPSGRFGQIAHELFEMKAHNNSVHAAGSFHDVHVTYVVKQLVNGHDRTPIPNEPFATHAVWMPTTTAHIRAPETNRFPVMRIERSTSHGLPADAENDLGPMGLPGYRFLGGLPGFEIMAAGDGRQLRARIAEAIGPWLNSRPDPHISLRVRYGLVALTVNGYRTDEADLRHLATCADAIAEALAAVPPVPPAVAFSSLGPMASTVSIPNGMPAPHPDLVSQYAELARQYGLHDEHVSHLVAVAPRCPIPGTASGVLAGTLPGTRAACRLVWFEQGGRTTGSVRGGVLIPAAPGAATPLGGQLFPETRMYVEVVDGLAACWRQQRSFGGLEPRELVDAATATLRSSGLAELS